MLLLLPYAFPSLHLAQSYLTYGSGLINSSRTSSESSFMISWQPVLLFRVLITVEMNHLQNCLVNIHVPL